MFVKPAPGLLVRDPHTGVRMPESGRDVPATDLEWHRLLQLGDIVPSEPPAEEPPKE